MEEAARIAFRLESVRRIRFVLWGGDALRTHDRVLEELLEERSGA